MTSKTQKIAEELHAALRLYAAKTGRTLQSVTEEIITDGLRNRGEEVNETTEKQSRIREGDSNNEGAKRRQ